jgi:hypothetical protein
MFKKYADSGYKKNKWKEKADRCGLRIQTYERILRKEVREYNTRLSKLLTITYLVNIERRESIEKRTGGIRTTACPSRK